MKPSASKPVVAAPAAPKSDMLKTLISLWIFLPAIPYFLLVNTYAVNFPFQDDYNAILEFLSNFNKAGFMDKIVLLFSQHNDHRILHSRIIYVIYNGLFGKIDFRTLIYIGNIQLIAIFYFIVQFIRKAVPKYWQIVSAVVCLVIFDPSSFENANFAMCGIQNYGIIMLFLATLYFFFKGGNKYMWLAAVIEIICIFSSGNGMICAFFVALALLLDKRKREAILSGSIMVVCAALYFYHYTKAIARGTVESAFSFERIGRFFLHMLGSHFSYDNGIIIGVLVLIATIVLLPVTRRLVIKDNTLPFFSMLGVIFASIVTTSVFRSSTDMGELASYSSRYLVYSHFLIAVLFVFLVIKLDATKYFWPSAAISVVVLIYAYKGNYAYGEANFNLEKMRLENTPYWYRDRKPEAEETARQIEQEACRLGIYCISDER